MNLQLGHSKKLSYIQYQSRNSFFFSIFVIFNSPLIFFSFDVLGGCDIWFTIRGNNFNYSSKQQFEVKPLKGKITHTFDLEIDIQGEARFEFFDEDLTTSESMFYFWIHSHFIGNENRMVLSRTDLDGRAKSKKDQHRFHQKFCIVLTFESLKQREKGED